LTKNNNAKDIAAISDITPDSKNANKGTQRGRGLLEKSLRQYGAGRSIVVDKGGHVIGGNKTIDVAADLGLPIRVVETDGEELVVVQRTDLDIDSAAGRGLAIADNRASEASLDWDTEMLLELSEGGNIDLTDFWKPQELEEMLEQNATADQWTEAFENLPDSERELYQQMTFVLHDTQAAIVKSALKTAKAAGAFNGENKNNNGNALARVCKAFVERNGRS
jgi:sporulation protein YlmC with PRC-barrel domain